jgi:hypothetical protein
MRGGKFIHPRHAATAQPHSRLEGINLDLADVRAIMRIGHLSCVFAERPSMGVMSSSYGEPSPPRRRGVGPEALDLAR